MNVSQFCPFVYHQLNRFIMSQTEKESLLCSIASAVAEDQFQADVDAGKVPESFRGTVADYMQQAYPNTEETKLVVSVYSEFSKSKDSSDVASN
jgi:hypothetical protein